MSLFIQLSIPALCAYRECRGGGRSGMQSIVNVLDNRAKRNHTSLYEEAIRPWQFSSMTAKGDSQTVLWPTAIDPEYATAEQLVQSAFNEQLPDITGGAILYYAPKSVTPFKFVNIPGLGEVRFPHSWDETKVHYICEVAGQLFFKEG